MKNISSIEKYPKAFFLSQKTLNNLGIENFPINILQIIKQLGIMVATVEEYIEFRKITNEKRPFIKIEDGRTYFIPQKKFYIIVYNQESHPRRIRFTLAHELGHILLHHLHDERTEINRGGVTDYIYYAMEGAANAFAGNFLAPPVLINELVCGVNYDTDLLSNLIAEKFLVSYKSMREYRFNDYMYWKNIELTDDERMLEQRCGHLMWEKWCPKCHHIFYDKYARCCPVCGAEELEKIFDRSDLEMEIYSKAETDEDCRLKKCLRCGNIELGSGSYCKICGKPVINRCSFENCDNREPLPSNARYCPYCGSESTFFTENLILPWSVEANGEYNLDEVLG